MRSVCSNPGSAESLQLLAVLLLLLLLLLLSPVMLALHGDVIARTRVRQLRLA